MPLFRRMSTIMRVKISHLLDRAERPGEILDYGYQQQVRQLYKLRRAIVDLVCAKRLLQRQQTTLEQKLIRLDAQARQALAHGREELARTALERKQLTQGELCSVDLQVQELESQQRNLAGSEQRLRARVQASRTRKEIVKARYSAAEAQVRISEATAGEGAQTADIGLSLQRAIEKTQGMQARAAAVDELEAAGVFDDLTVLGSGNDIERQLERLAVRSAVDHDLVRLKAQLGPPVGTGGLSAPSEMLSIELPRGR